MLEAIHKIYSKPNYIADKSDSPSQFRRAEQEAKAEKAFKLILAYVKEHEPVLQHKVVEALPLSKYAAGLYIRELVATEKLFSKLGKRNYRTLRIGTPVAL